MASLLQVINKTRSGETIHAHPYQRISRWSKPNQCSVLGSHCLWVMFTLLHHRYFHVCYVQTSFHLCLLQENILSDVCFRKTSFCLSKTSFDITNFPKTLEVSTLLLSTKFTGLNHAPVSMLFPSLVLIRHFPEKAMKREQTDTREPMQHLDLFTPSVLVWKPICFYA